MLKAFGNLCPDALQSDSVCGSGMRRPQTYWKSTIAYVWFAYRELTAKPTTIHLSLTVIPGDIYSKYKSIEIYEKE